MLFLTLAARNLEVLTVRLLLGMQCWRFAPIPKPFQMRTYWVYPSVFGASVPTHLGVVVSLCFSILFRITTTYYCSFQLRSHSCLSNPNH